MPKASDLSSTNRVRLQCAHCGDMAKLVHFRDGSHGQTSHRCVSRRWRKWVKENDYWNSGQHTHVLVAAGLVRYVPQYVGWWINVDPDGNEVPWRSLPKGFKPERREALNMRAMCPAWAWRMAQSLTDPQLARRLGHVQRRRLVTLTYDYEVHSSGLNGKTYRRVPTEQEWRDCDLDKRLPYKVRLRVLQSAAKSCMAREMIEDDLEAATRIIGDLL